MLPTSAAASNLIWWCFGFIRFLYFSVFVLFMKHVLFVLVGGASVSLMRFLFSFVLFVCFLLHTTSPVASPGTGEGAYPSCLRLGLFCLPLFGLPLLYIRNSFLGYLFRLNFLLFFPFFSFSLFFHFFISIFPSISVSMYLGCRRADVCCACRIQYDGIVVLRCILLLQHYDELL